MLNKSHTYKGYWWHPSNPDEKVAGILEYIPNDSIRLEIFGDFNSDSNLTTIKRILEGEKVDVIHGECSDTKKITLFNCFSSGSWNTSSFPIIQFSCSYVVLGKLLDNYEQNSFFKATCFNPELNLWCPPKLIQSTYNTEDSNFKQLDIRITPDTTPIAEFKLEELNIKIIQSATVVSDHFEPKISQCTKFEIHSNQDQSIATFLHAIHIIEQFLSIACLTQSQCTQIEFYSKNDYQIISDQKKNFKPIEFLYIQDIKSKNIELIHFRPLIIFDYIKEKLNTISTTFFANNDIAPIREHLVECIKNKRVFSSVDFLIIIQAIEGFWWRFRDASYREKHTNIKKNTSLETILNELVSEFKDIQKLNLQDLSILNAVDSRHYFSHFFEKNKKPNVIDGYELYALSVKLRKLLICCVLSLMGLTNSDINTIIAKSNNQVLYD